MPGTVATNAKRDALGPADQRPILLVKATMTGGQAAAANATTRIGQSDAVSLPRGTRELQLTFNVTAAATDATDKAWAIVELQYQDTWVPVLSVECLGNATEPIMYGASLQATTGGGQWAVNSGTAPAGNLNDSKQLPGCAQAARLAFYVVADADGTQDDLFTGSAELWAA